MVVPKTTSETLKHKINPSAGETAPQAIEVLLYTPGILVVINVWTWVGGQPGSVRGKPHARNILGASWL